MTKLLNVAESHRPNAMGRFFLFIYINLGDIGCHPFVEQLPDIADVLMEKSSEGVVKVIVLSDDGGTVYELEPKQESAND